MKHDPAIGVVCPHGTTFLQFVGDNTDHDVATIDGKNTHHGLGSIAIANGAFSETNLQIKALPRDSKEKCSTIVTNEGIPIKQYHSPDMTALGRTILKPIALTSAIIIPIIDLLWNCSYFFKSAPPSWSGCMSLVSSNDPLPKSIVTMLPVINLHATDMNAL